MPRVNSVRYSERKIDFKYEINVDKQGVFSTTIPKDIVALLKNAGVDLQPNRAGNYGYFWDETCDGLMQKVRDVMAEYMSQELISDKIIIKYVIQTSCSYCLDKKGGIAPNGANEWTGRDEYKWIDGTKDMDSGGSAFGLLVYAEPYIRKDFKYKSGDIRSEYIKLCYADPKWKKIIKDGYYLRWLDSVASICNPSYEEPMEVDYTEETAVFFVNLIVSICKLNEKIKNKLDPKSIIKMISSGKKLLT